MTITLTCPPNLTVTDLETARFALGQLALHNQNIDRETLDCLTRSYLFLSTASISPPPAAS